MRYGPFQPAMSGVDQILSYKISVTVASGTAQALSGAPQVRLHNIGSARAYVNFGTKNVAAQVSDIPIDPGQCEVLSVPAGAEFLNTIGDGNTTLHVTPGDGL